MLIEVLFKIDVWLIVTVSFLFWGAVEEIVSFLFDGILFITVDKVLFTTFGSMVGETVCATVEFYNVVFVELSTGFYSDAVSFLIELVFAVMLGWVELVFVVGSVWDEFFYSG